MIKEKQEAAVSKAKETFNELADSYSEEFAERIGNIDAEPERERIFLLEEMIGDALSKSSAQWLEFNQDLIHSIDEKELIERKKANTRERV